MISHRLWVVSSSKKGFNILRASWLFVFILFVQSEFRDIRRVIRSRKHGFVTFVEGSWKLSHDDNDVDEKKPSSVK